MSSSKAKIMFGAALLLAAGFAQASGYILGLSGEADSSGGRALSAFADWGVTDSTWLSGAVARTNTGGALGGLETLYLDASVEQSIGQAGFRVGAAYWGDDDILDSANLRGSVFYRGETASLTFDYERRDFDFVFRPALDPTVTRTAEFTADGIGGGAWLKASDKVSVFVSGMAYEYSRDLRIQPSIDTLLFLSSSRLSLMNSLVDYSVSGGLEFQLGQKDVDVTLSSWRTAIDGGRVNSIAVGLIGPSGSASDVYIRLAFDESENFGSTVALAVSFFYFGG